MDISILVVRTIGLAFYSVPIFILLLVVRSLLQADRRERQEKAAAQKRELLEKDKEDKIVKELSREKDIEINQGEGVNKKQKIISIIFAVIIFLASLLAIINESYLASILGILISFGLLIYGLSGRTSKDSEKRDSRQINYFGKLRKSVFLKWTGVVILIVILD